MLITLITAIAAALGGALIAWLLTRARAQARLDVEGLRAEHLRQQATELRQRVEEGEAAVARSRQAAAEQLARSGELQTQLAELRAQHQERLASFEQARLRMEETFKSLSSDALRHSQEGFLRLAGATFEKFQAQADGRLEQREQAVKALVDPIGKSLEGVRTKIDELEKVRAEAYGSLTAQVRSMSLTQDQLRTEASNLVKALRAPQTRGRWGELQLKRVVEMANMLEHCDFEQQVSVQGDDGRLRPDLIVRLPGDKRVVVDAKAPLQAYLDAVEAPDDAARQLALAHHARQLREHIVKLGSKNYQQQFPSAPEFVVLFLPGESFFSAALEQQPGLIEEGVEKKVIVATPTTLIALLRAVAYGWQEKKLADNAEEIARHGRELYARIARFGDTFGKIGRSLGSAVQSYNDAVGTLERRVLPSARRFRELAGSGDEIPAIESLQDTTRRLQAPELVATDLLGEPLDPDPPA